jgi:hypothetical protein
MKVTIKVESKAKSDAGVDKQMFDEGSQFS